MAAWAKSKYKELGGCYKDYRKEYQVWINMKERCMNPKNEMFSAYGKRGIKVCDRWLGEDGFLNFYKDMGKRPTGEDGRVFQIDRIDNDGNYCPENCRWVHPKVNARNRSDNVFITIYGEKMCKQDACKLLGISRTAVERHMARGEDADSAVIGILKRKGYVLTIPERIA